MYARLLVANANGMQGERASLQLDRSRRILSDCVGDGQKSDVAAFVLLAQVVHGVTTIERCSNVHHSYLCIDLCSKRELQKALLSCSLYLCYLGMIVIDSY